MYILKSNQLRINPNKPYIDENGIKYSKMPSHLYQEINEPPIPQDGQNYNRVDLIEPPYVVYTLKTVSELFNTRQQLIKSIRDNLVFNGGTKVGTKWFHSDTHSKVQQLALLIAGQNLPQNLQWKTMDGTFITMTSQLAQDLYLAQMAQEQAIFAIAEIKINDNSDPNTGWPEVFVPGV